MKMMMFFFFNLVMFFVLNCTNTYEPEMKDKDFLNTVWTLTAFEIDGEKIAPPKDQTFTIQFKADSTVSGKNDCNDFSANYLIPSRDSLKIFNYVVTEMGCGGDRSIRYNYTQAIREAKSYDIHEKKLYIYYGDNSGLIFYGE